jgi:serine/threonine protein kinase
VCKYAIEISRGLVAIHDHGIAHLDLKPDNILLGFDNILRISDFGNAVDVIPETYDVVTLDYRPPEVFGEIPWDDFGDVMKADVWSLGCIVYELYRGRLLFHRDWTKPWCAAEYTARINQVNSHTDWFIPKSIEGSILSLVDRFTSLEVLQKFETLYNTNETILEHWD